ncbi:MAG: hypothetical protein BIFFINMI_03091 [Phycisphaerae bacterium]|nr:hypothetical protein [Phycisphaerae bacterium]
MPTEYESRELLHADDFADFVNWHHEGVGEIGPGPVPGQMRLHCLGSRQGGPGCMAFFRPTLPDRIAVEYDLVVRSHGGLVINYIAIRGLDGQDLIADRDRLPPRTGVMSDYYAAAGGLQSYHISFSRFDDAGRHTDTSNGRRNPGMLLMSQGVDHCTEIGRAYRIRVVKDGGHVQLWVDGKFSHSFFDRDTRRYPIPDTGKFGFRLIGSDVMADVSGFRVYRIDANEEVWRDKA